MPLPSAHRYQYHHLPEALSFLPLALVLKLALSRQLKLTLLLLIQQVALLVEAIHFVVVQHFQALAAPNFRALNCSQAQHLL